MTLRFAYNTNGTAHHRLHDAIALIADSGYDGVALTLDIHHCDPFAEDLSLTVAAVARDLAARRMGCVIETGARFLLDARAKHEPTLVTASPEGRARRVDFLSCALLVARETGAECVSFWGGVPKPGVAPADARRWLREGVIEIVARAERMGVVAAFEPEPGMIIETAAEWRALDIPGLRLALDTGHCIVTGDIDPVDAVRAYADDIATVSIEDMRRGVHVHLPFGEGDMDVPAVLAALRDVRCGKLICVELSRDSHRADVMVPAALRYLRG